MYFRGRGGSRETHDLRYLSCGYYSPQSAAICGYTYIEKSGTKWKKQIDNDTEAGIM